MAKEKGIPITNKKKAELITELAKPDSVRQQEKAEKEAVKDAAKVKNKNPTKPKKFSIGDLDPTVLPTGILLKQSYLRPQTRGPRLAAKIGHRNEEPFLTSFFWLSQKPNDDGDEYSFSAISPVAIYRVGLMRKKGASKFAKASLDAVTFIKRNNDDANSALELVPTEVKSRVSPSTWSEASDRIEDIIGAELCSPRRKYLIPVSSSDGLLRTLIHDKKNQQREKDEAFQLLHGVFVSDAKRGLLLVGSCNELVYGIDVTFEQKLLDAYRAVLEYIYETYVQIFYEGSIQEIKSNPDIFNALKALDFMDEHAFWSAYMLW